MTPYGLIDSEHSESNSCSLGFLPPPDVPDFASIIIPSLSINPCFKNGIRTLRDEVG